MASRLVINADDLGYSEERDLGIFQCFLHGRSISSASVLANGTTAAAALTHAVQIRLPVGLHFNITEGKPLSSPQTLPTLTKNGLFLGRLPFMDQIDNCKISAHEIEEELTEQIKWFENVVGHLPDHVDGHQHVHVMPGVRDVFAEVMQKKGIIWTRVPQEKCDTNECSHPLRYILANCKASAETFTSHKLRFPTSFIGISVMGRNMTLERLAAAIARNVDQATTYNACELMVHPGYKCKGIGGCGSGPDDFSKSEDREHEMGLLQSSEWKKLINNFKFSLCSFDGLPT